MIAQLAVLAVPAVFLAGNQWSVWATRKFIARRSSYGRSK